MNNVEEIWIDVKDFEGAYQVSSFGNVRSIDKIARTYNGGLRLYKGRILVKKVGSLGKYHCVDLSNYGKGKRFGIHRLVAENFIPNPENKAEVNHKDGNTFNNHIDNLEWVTRSENIRHSFKNPLRKKGTAPRDKIHLTKIKTHQIPEIIRLYRENVGYRYIAEKFNMSISGLEKIVAKYKNNEQYVV